MVKIVMLGPPGSGKGTYSQRMSPKLEIPTISTGELFRENLKQGTEIGNKAKEYMEKGELVPDEIVIGMLQQRIQQKDTEKGFILDGFPRTIAQAEALDKVEKIDAVINLVVPDEIVIARLSSRRECKKCGKIYNTLYLKPKVEGICDVCSGELYQRADDMPETIKERLRVYIQNTQPLIDYYGAKGNRIDIPCNSVDVPPDEQVEKIMTALKEKGVI